MTLCPPKIYIFIIVAIGIVVGITCNVILCAHHQELDKELHSSRTECIELQRNMAESQLKWSREKDALKKATKYFLPIIREFTVVLKFYYRQHKEHASRSEETIERLQSHLEDTVSPTHFMKWSHDPILWSEYTATPIERENEQTGSSRDVSQYNVTVSLVIL